MAERRALPKTPSASSTADCTAARSVAALYRGNVSASNNPNIASATMSSPRVTPAEVRPANHGVANVFMSRLYPPSGFSPHQNRADGIKMTPVDSSFGL